MSQLWAISGWAVAAIAILLWVCAHLDANHYRQMYRDADAGWGRAIQKWRDSLNEWEAADRRRADRERAP